MWHIEVTLLNPHIVYCITYRIRHWQSFLIFTLPYGETMDAGMCQWPRKGKSLEEEAESEDVKTVRDVLVAWLLFVDMEVLSGSQDHCSPSQSS